jgi:hypothetical protein
LFRSWRGGRYIFPFQAQKLLLVPKRVSLRRERRQHQVYASKVPDIASGVLLLLRLTLLEAPHENIESKANVLGFLENVGGGIM